MTSMRRRYVASTSLRRHVSAGNLAPLAPPQYSKPCPPPPPPQYSKTFLRLCQSRLVGDRVAVDLYTKPADTYQYHLPYTCHPKHCCKINRIYHRYLIQIKKSQPEGERIMPETRFTVDPRVGISLSASETDV